MRERGIPESDILKACYQNALDAYGQSGNMKESDWVGGLDYDQSVLYGGNSVLRGQEPQKSNPDIVEN